MMTDFTPMPPAARQGSPRHRKATHSAFRSSVLAAVLGMAVLAGLATTLRGGTLYLPNNSFESPTVPPVSPYATNAIDFWEVSPQPDWYDPSQNYDTPWDDLAGVFYNVPYPETFITNCDGSQAAYLFALPGMAVFQDYDSVSGTDTFPSHAFNAQFKPGRSYTLTVGLTSSTEEPLNPGATFQISLYYRDSSSNMVTVAATNVTFDTTVFTNLLQFLDFQAQLPTVQAGDAWAGQNIGVQLGSTVDFSLVGGVWDLDNVRLVETVTPALANAGVTNGQIGFTLLSEPGLAFEIQAAPNLAATSGQWVTIGTLTNVTGTTSFADALTNAHQRFYRAHQL
jgi:hypothetical protein